MVGKTPRAITREEARTRFREVAADLSTLQWVRDHPRDALIAAAGAGFLVGAFPAVAQEAVEILSLRCLLRSRITCNNWREILTAIARRPRH